MNATDRFGLLVCVFLAAATAGRVARGQTPPPPPASDEARLVADAARTLEEMLNTPGGALPRGMLAGAEGVAIVPHVIKGGFIVGARHGRGVLVTKDPQGEWHTPIFLTLTGGNVGWQAGLQSADVVLVYRSQRSVESLMRGKLTLGADVAAAAGPVGREAAAATDLGLKAEVYSYCRSRGLFVGLALDGSVLKIDQAATAAYYRPPTPGGAAIVPVEAHRLTARVVGLASGQTVAPPPDAAAPQQQWGLDARHNLDESAALRDQLAEAATRLTRLLDADWRRHLALPAEVFRETGQADPTALAETLARYDTVARDPRYAELAGRPEFQTVYGLLRHYEQAVADKRPPLNLPPPPGR